MNLISWDCICAFGSELIFSSRRLHILLNAWLSCILACDWTRFTPAYNLHLHAERVQIGGAGANIFMNIKQSLHTLTRESGGKKNRSNLILRVCVLSLVLVAIKFPLLRTSSLLCERQSICPSINKTADLNILSLGLREWSHSVRGRSSGSHIYGVFLDAKLIMRQQSFECDPLAMYFRARCRLLSRACWLSSVGGNWYCLIYCRVHPTLLWIKI